MKLDSKFFDRLRVKPDENRMLRDTCPSCEWQGCREPGLYPAPKGRNREGQYHRFCLDHVRQYNKTYNYFSGLPDEAVVKHQKDDTIGHRPTWFIGVNPWARNRGSKQRPPVRGYGHSFETRDPFNLFAEEPAAKAARMPWSATACPGLPSLFCGKRKTTSLLAAVSDARLSGEDDYP